MPSILARSLIRDVAVAVETAHANKTAATTAAEPSLHLLLPKRSDGTGIASCVPTWTSGVNSIDFIAVFHERGRALPAVVVAGFPAILAGAQAARFYRPLTITGPPCRTCVSLDQTERPRRKARRRPGVRRAGLYAFRGERAPEPKVLPWPCGPLGGIDALIALQGIEDPVERRRRAVRHGPRALDALDELKIGLLAGDIEPGGSAANSRPWRRTSRTARVTTGSIWF